MLAAAILAVSILFYVLVYTVWLKRRTPQNIVIGGGAGAFPPLIGWAAATGHITALPIALFALVFLWTPPHFWALALFVQTRLRQGRRADDAGGRGRGSTRRQILLYSLLLLPLSIVPWWIGGAGAIYGVSAAVLSIAFLALAARVGLRRREGPGDTMKPEKQLFAFSIIYLFALFAALVADRLAGQLGVPRLMEHPTRGAERAGREDPQAAQLRGRRAAGRVRGAGVLHIHCEDELT